MCFCVYYEIVIIVKINKLSNAAEFVSLVFYASDEMISL